ncbi:hypothetical protein OG909_29235 [Streptomyces sp. NBC_01754]|uniref:DUF6801 domain-containing protein n=1 Tax=Streptomyces sp. NBC_01754 TaxID=2975930 RepID=UPI002DD85412|nr:DUF6801 domain-containing protein [Streptomyces sp. NBC_01754]WSC96047.1 hypothetical protein OG909_29235 [Streptomyces sp. NBC_01754]
MAARARRTARHSSRLAAGGLLIVAAAFLPGAASAVDAEEVEVPLDYTCQFPTGTHTLTAVLSGNLPADAMAGVRYEPRDIALDLELPRPLLEDLAGLGAASVAARADLSVLHRSGEDTATAAWNGLEAPAQEIAGQDEVTLHVSGDVPTATFGAPGTATLSASDLKLALSPLRADGSPAGPAATEAECRLGEGADGTLATVTVGGEGHGQPSGPSEADPSGHTELETRMPPDRRKQLDAARQEAADADDPDDPGSCPYPPLELSMPAEAFVAGYTNVAKMDGAALLGPAQLNITMMREYLTDPCKGTFTALSDADFEYEGRRQLPPAKATFLTYGFMPTTATMELVQVGPPALITSISDNSEPTQPEYTTVEAELDIRIKDVQVNGVPLDVGPGCHTVEPVKQVLHAFGTSNPPTGYTVERGGTMDGETYVPAFTGCGVGEDLSPLLTASISGPGNYIKITQAPLCVLTNPTSEHCPAKKPVPER